MKRDMELIRLLLFTEERGERPAELDQYSEEDILYNYSLMADAGLIDAELIPELGVPQHVNFRRLTWAGHDFLDAIKEDTVWQKAKNHVLKPGASWTFSVLLEWLKQEAHNRVFGIPPSN